MINYYTINETAEILGLSHDRVRKKIHQIRRKCFPGAIQHGFHWLIPVGEVMREKEYMDKRNKS